MSISTESPQGEPVSSETSEQTAGVALMGGDGAGRCGVCDAKLAIDQRYCVECGTRRGSPRFTLATPTADTSAQTGSALAQFGSGAVTRVQLMLALLIVVVAIGVGVLIGHGTAGTSASRPAAVSSSSTSPSGGSHSGKSASGTKSSTTNLFSSGG